MIGLAPINTETGLYGVNFFLSLKGKTQANEIPIISGQSGGAGGAAAPPY